jgi:phospholipid/cholesterol/gamma-HCH transport system ATP-binding protein
MGRHEPLGQVAEARARARLAALPAEQRDPAAVGAAQIEHALDQRGLAGAVEPGQAEGLACLHGQVDRAQHLVCAESLGERRDPQRRYGKDARRRHRHMLSRPRESRSRVKSRLFPRRPASAAPSVADSLVVRIRNVSFGYDPTRRVLHDVSLEIPRGKVVGIMGQSGCGKTTLLRIIGGALAPSEGEAQVLGRSMRGLSRDDLYALRRRLGMLFQFGALFTDMTAYDNVAFPLREHTALPAPLIRDLVLLKLEAVGLRGAAARLPAELSGGMARRVALARAIALDPELMLYDEPFTGLDPISFGVIARLVRELNDSLGATSIVVSHDVAECMAIVDYLYFMSEGRIVAQGTPEEIRRVEVPFVHQFIHGEMDGPVPFHYPAPGYGADLGVAHG